MAQQTVSGIAGLAVALAALFLPAVIAWFFYFKKGKNAWLLVLALLLTGFCGAATYFGVFIPDQTFDTQGEDKQK